VGSFFEPVTKRLSCRKRWIAHGLKAKGVVVIDDGAARALTEKGKSLLPTGILDVNGQFKIGDAICCISLQGEPVARGLTNYSSDDLLKIKGEKSGNIEAILGYKYSDEVIHRDNLVLDEIID
jgi:glutamate 5-kinase